VFIIAYACNFHHRVNMSWVTGSSGNVRLTINGVKVQKFSSEADCAERILQGGVIPMAFAYPGGSHWFALWEGTHLEMATWFYNHHEEIEDEHCTLLENTRGCAVKLGFDIDQPYDGPKPLAEAEKEMVEKITEILATDVYKRLFKSKKSSKGAIRFFSASRPTEDGWKLSLHVNCRGVAFASTADAKRLVQFLLPKFEGMKVDLTYYDTARKIRLPYMRKSAKVRRAFVPINSQLEDNCPSDLMLTAVSDQDRIFSLDEIGELIPEFSKWNDTTTKSAPAPAQIGRVTDRKMLSECGRSTLNTYFGVPAITTYSLSVKDSGTVYLYPEGSTFCTLNPGHKHDIRQGCVVVKLSQLDYFRKCWGAGCGSSQIVFSSEESSMQLRMAILQATDCGEALPDADPVYKMLPPGEWRIARCNDNQVYLQSPDKIVALFRKGVTTYDRATGLQTLDICSDKTSLLVTVHRARLVECLERDGMNLTFTAEEARRLETKDNQNGYSVVFQNYLIELLRVRGIRATKDGQRLYRLKAGSNFLYERIPEVKDVHSLVEWLRADVFAHAPLPYQRVIERWSGFSNFETQFKMNIGSRVKMVKPALCIGFRNGVQFFPNEISNERGRMRDWFKTKDEMVDAEDAALPLFVFDVDYDEQWADDLSFANSMKRALDFQGFRPEFQDLYLATVLGRAVLQKCLLQAGCFDSYHIQPITSGAPGTFKSEAVRAAQDLFASRCADLAKPRGNDLACIQHIADEYVDLLIISDARLSAKRLFGEEFDLVAWRNHVDNRPIPISKIRDKTDGAAMVSSGLIITINTTTNPWGYHTHELREKLSVARRDIHFVFRKQPDSMDASIEADGKSDLQRAALLIYSMQRYLDMRLADEPWSASRMMEIPEIAAGNRDAAIHYIPLVKWIHEGVSNQIEPSAGPYVIKEGGSYVTIGRLIKGYTKYMSKRLKRDYTGGCEPGDVRAAMTVLFEDMVKYASGDVSKDGRVSYCGDCHGKSRKFNQRGVGCSHRGLSEFHSKEVKLGALLDFQLVDDDDDDSGYARGFKP
jgi:hypothetical protein